MNKALCTAEFDATWAQQVNEIMPFDRVGFSLDLDPKSRMSSEDLCKALKGYSVFFCGYEKTTRKVLECNPDLALILSVRDGPEENIDVASCTELGIPVISCRGRCANSVPEFLVTQMLLMAKPTIRVTNTVRQEGWTKENDLRLRRLCESSHELHGSTIGIIGFGRNGKGLAQRLQGFGITILAYDPYLSQEDAINNDIKLVSFETLCSESDYVVMMARVTKETKHMMDTEHFSLMKDGACFVNAARSALIDSNALLAELRSGRLRAALDVFDCEPIGPNSPWYDIPEDRLLLTSHLAGLSLERIAYQSRQLHDLLLAYLQGSLDSSRLQNPDALDARGFKSRGGRLMGILS